MKAKKVRIGKGIEVFMIGWILTGGLVPMLLLLCGVFFII